MKNLIQYPEIYRLPIIVTEKDLEIEKEYLEFYNDEYWKEYKRKNNKGVSKVLG
mgnify:CR=1 FL=1|tara:strand:+ start:696 stop:857 length:162 start_codon:yes stop_codon:yes gene_type:complete